VRRTGGRGDRGVVPWAGLREGSGVCPKSAVVSHGFADEREDVGRERSAVTLDDIE
jgi:hypothetical protein